MDKKRILLDGVCKPLYPYIGTPISVVSSLKNPFPDIVAFTHKHTDHYDEDFAKDYETKTLRHCFVPEASCFYKIDSITLSFIKTRHIGKTNIPHTSILILGSKNILFTGDASPSEFKTIINQLPKVDVLLAPFAYVSTNSAYSVSKSITDGEIFILHLPKEEDDSLGLNKSVLQVCKADEKVHILPINGNIIIND